MPGFSSSSIPRPFSAALLLRVWIPSTTPTQVQDLARGHIELFEVLMGLLLKPVMSVILLNSDCNII